MIPETLVSLDHLTRLMGQEDSVESSRRLCFKSHIILLPLKHY